MSLSSQDSCNNCTQQKTVRGLKRINLQSSQLNTRAVYLKIQGARISWNRNSLIPSNFPVMRETESKNFNSWMLKFTAVQKPPSGTWQFGIAKLVFGQFYQSRIEILQRFLFQFLSWEENLREQDNLFFRKSM